MATASHSLADPAFASASRGHEGRDCEAVARTAPVEPLVNEQLREPDIASDLLGVNDHAAVVPTSLQLALESDDDFWEREAPRFLQPIFQHRHGVSELLGVGATVHHPMFWIASALMPSRSRSRDGIERASASSRCGAIPKATKGQKGSMNESPVKTGAPEEGPRSARQPSFNLQHYFPKKMNE